MDIKLKTNCEDPKLEFLNIEKYGDRSGFGAVVHVISNGFAAKVFVTFGEYPMERFIEQLKSCDESLSGSATLEPEWDNWFIKFHIEGNGSVLVSGMLYTPDQELKYEFTTDQTCLSGFIKDLESWHTCVNT